MRNFATARLYVYKLSIWLLILVAGCTNEINLRVPGPVVQEGQIGGKIVLPANSKVDTTGLHIMSAISSALPVNSGYAIDTSGKTSTTFLLNRGGDVLLIGYNYPGQTVSDVSAESTALAFLMNTLTMRSLSVNGRLEAIKKIRAGASFGKLVEVVENSLKSGKAVSDTTNTELIEAIGAVFESSISGLRTSKPQGHRDPIIISTANTELQLRNNMVAHSYVAGIYKDGVLKRTLTIGGYTFFAKGILEGLEAIFNDGYGIPEAGNYTMSEEGEYAIRIRSGRPGSDDGTAEHRKARTENVVRFIYRQIVESLPLPDECAGAVLEALRNRIFNVMAAKEVVLNNASTATDFAFLATNIATDVLGDTKGILEKCDGVPEESFEFFKGMSKVMKIVGKATKVADAVMRTANIYSHTEDLFKSTASIDTCFQVVGLKTFACGEDITYLVREEAGNNQKGESGKPLDNPLKVKVTYEDGKPAIKAKVTWLVKSGGGTLGSALSTTDNEGNATTTWTLGNGDQVQKVEAFVNRKEESKSVVFEAKFSQKGKLTGSWIRVREYGVHNGSSFDERYNLADISALPCFYSLVIRGNGSMDFTYDLNFYPPYKMPVTWPSGHVPCNTETLSFQYDENTGVIKWTAPGDGLSNNDENYGTFLVKELTETKLVIEDFNIHESVQEYVRVQ